MNVYFAPAAYEADVLDVKEELEALPEVAEVEYVSREQALEDFRGRHENDQLTLQALDELDENPLGAVLNIRAKETSQYESIATFLEESDALSQDGDALIDNVNYFQNKVTIDRLTDIINASERIGFAVTLVLTILSVLITFNTIRLAIYTSRDEIKVMRLWVQAMRMCEVLLSSKASWRVLLRQS